MMKKRCELCKSTATIFCESDQANLCWDCDTKVHSANFLVAKHLRTLLCHVCRSPTPWNASGERLCKTVSVCQSCVDRFKARESKASAADEAVEIDVEDDECDECYDRDVEDAAVEEEEEGENQVVASEESSSSRFCNGGGAAVSSNRVRENPQDLPSDDGLRRSTSHRETSSLPAASSPTKRRKTDMT
ncbi:hypothetical protein Vadar_021053 [Vaccinium darrowii]|uniref:Uncharacterized protein n=1 Tax=Vaccinium darrowii TaxID=229202 RepID=A0ACB7XST5_9ERIC|nr:hypothetical protein Vadar_021053 [Vaccinium darrowii]